MSRTITTGMVSGKIHGITVNTSKKCNSSNYTNASSRNVSYVVMHYTGNEKDTAKANANYFQGSWRKASAHFFVDDENIYQSVELRDKAWHCGTSGTYYHKTCRNANSFGVEMCTSGDSKISDTTKENAAYVCAYLCKLIGITAGQVDTYVLRHYDVTHKACPAQMAGSNNKEWTAFKAKVKKILRETEESKTESEESKTESKSETGGSYMFSVETVKKGSTGNDVKLLQRLLKSNGCKGADGENLEIDGSAGSNTVYAIKAYQEKKGLTVDGSCGPASWKSILLR